MVVPLRPLVFLLVGLLATAIADYDYFCASSAGEAESYTYCGDVGSIEGYNLPEDYDTVDCLNIEEAPTRSVRCVEHAGADTYTVVGFANDNSLCTGTKPEETYTIKQLCTPTWRCGADHAECPVDDMEIGFSSPCVGREDRAVGCYVTVNAASVVANMSCDEAKKPEVTRSHCSWEATYGTCTWSGTNDCNVGTKAITYTCAGPDGSCDEGVSRPATENCTIADSDIANTCRYRYGCAPEDTTEEQFLQNFVTGNYADCGETAHYNMSTLAKDCTGDKFHREVFCYDWKLTKATDAVEANECSNLDITMPAMDSDVPRYQGCTHGVRYSEYNETTLEVHTKPVGKFGTSPYDDCKDNCYAPLKFRHPFCLNTRFNIIGESERCTGYSYTEITLPSPCGNCKAEWVCASEDSPDWQSCAAGDGVGFSPTTCSMTTGANRTREVMCAVKNGSEYKEVMPSFCEQPKPEKSADNKCKYEFKCTNARNETGTCTDVCDVCSTTRRWDGTPKCMDDNNKEITDSKEKYFCAPEPELPSQSCTDTCKKGWLCSSKTAGATLHECSETDQTSGFDLPNNDDGKSCLDPIPERNVECKQYYTEDGVIKVNAAANTCDVSAKPPTQPDRELCIYEWKCSVTDPITNKTSLKDCAKTVGVCTSDSPAITSQCFLGTFQKTVVCIDQDESTKDNAKCKDLQKPSTQGDKCIALSDCNFMWMCAKENELKPSTATKCPADDLTQAFDSATCYEAGERKLNRTVTCAADVNGVPIVAQGSKCNEAEKPNSSKVVPKCHPWTENKSVCTPDGVSCRGGTTQVTYTCDKDMSCNDATRPNNHTQSCLLPKEQFQCNFDYHCFPANTTDADLSKITDTSCDDDHYLRPVNNTCYAAQNYTRRVVCYDDEKNKIARNESMCFNKPVEAKELADDSGCDFSIYYSFEMKPEYHTNETDHSPVKYCNSDYNLFIPDFKYPYCYNDDLNVIVDDDKCDKFPTAIPVPAEPCAGAAVPAQWYCAATAEDFANSKVELCTDKFGRGGYAEETCSMDKNAMRERVVHCALYNTTDSVAIVVNYTLCKAPEPVAKESNTCSFEQLCFDEENETYKPCESHCIHCTDKHTPMSPVCVKKGVQPDTYVPIDTQHDDEFLCDPVPQPPKCENKCTYQWFCAQNAGEAPFTGYDTCATNDVTTHFGLPQGYPDQCVDATPTRDVKCLQYYETEELDAWDQPILAIHSEAENESVCTTGKPVTKLDDAPLCKFNWKCRVYADDGTFSYKDCNEVERVCLADTQELTDTKCFDGTLQRDVVCVNQSGYTDDSNERCTEDAPDNSCTVDEGCKSDWKCAASATDAVVACDAANGSNGFTAQICVESAEEGVTAVPIADTRHVGCYTTISNKLVSMPSNRCDAETEPTAERTIPVCAAWTAKHTTCVWDNKTCFGGTRDTSYVCEEGEGFCVSNKPDDIANDACTLDDSQCTFGYVCVPTGTADDAIVDVNDLSCEKDNHFIAATERKCYKNKTFTRRTVCYESSLHIVSDNASEDCKDMELPATSRVFTNEEACTHTSYCAVTGHTDFVDAAKSADVVECAADDVEAKLTECTIVCNRAERTRAVHCVSEVGTPVEPAKCGAMPAAVISCETTPTISNFVVKALDEDFIVGQRVQIDWCYYAGNLATSPQGILSVSSASSAFLSTRLAHLDVAASTVTVTLPTVASAKDAVITLSSSVDTVTTLSFELKSKCRADASYCGSNGKCNDKTSTCTCLNGYSGVNCEISPCEAAQCHPDHSACSNEGVNAGMCVCHKDFTGARCERSVTCKHEVCANGGYLHEERGICASTCTCQNQWQGNDCATCGLTCTAAANGKPNSDCSACVCNRGYTGEACACRQVYGTLIFMGAPASQLQSTAWQATLKEDLALVLDVPAAALEFVLPHPSTGKLGVTLTSCTAGQEVAELNTQWALLKQDLLSTSGILRTGTAMRQIDAHNAKIYNALAVYDPACVGVACMQGVNPFDEKPYEPICGEEGNACVYDWKCRVYAADGTFSYKDCNEVERVCLADTQELTDTKCFDGTLQRDVVCVNQSGYTDDSNERCTEDAPDNSCTVDEGCKSDWKCAASATDAVVACDAANGSNGFTAQICVESAEEGVTAVPIADTRHVGCYTTISNKLVSMPSNRCDAETEPTAERTIPVCAAWTAKHTTCVWDNKTCFGGTRDTSYVCEEGEGFCVSNKPDDIANDACTLDDSQCTFGYVCVPTGTADDAIVDVNDLSCEKDNHFIAATERKCYKNKTFTRRTVCYESSLHIVSDNASEDCKDMELPATSRVFTNEDACTHTSYCAVTGHTDFVDAAKSADVVECAADDVEAKLTECTIVCNRAERTRAVHCVSEVGTPVEPAKCGIMPAAVVACQTDATVSKLVVKALDEDFIVGQRVQIDWCYYAGDVETAPEAVLSLYTPSNSFRSSRLARVPVSDSTVTVTLPTVASAEDAVILLESSINAASTKPFEMQSKCRADASYCGDNGKCDDKTSICTCLNGYSGVNCEISPCEAAQCHPDHSACSNEGVNAGMCVCHKDFTGARCEYSLACDSNRCRNGGFLENQSGICSAACTCRNKWQGDECATCGLTCTAAANGKPNSDCSACVCNRGYTGEACACRAIHATLTFRNLPTSLLTNKAWLAALKQDVMVITGLSADELDLSVPYPETGKIAITIKYCGSLTPSFLNRVLRMKALNGLESVYDKWTLVTSDMNNVNSLLLTGTAMKEATGLGATVTPSAEVFDPACTGVGCPRGEDPLLPPFVPEPSSEDHTTTIVAVVVVLGSAIIIGAVLVWYCYFHKKQQQQQQDVTNTPKETEGVADVEMVNTNVDVVYNETSLEVAQE